MSTRDEIKNILDGAMHGYFDAGAIANEIVDHLYEAGLLKHASDVPQYDDDGELGTFLNMMKKDVAALEASVTQLDRDVLTLHRHAQRVTAICEGLGFDV